MNLIRYYNQNRKKIWGIVIIIFSAFIVLQLLNYIYEKTNQNPPANNTNILELNTNTTKLTENKSVVTGESKSSEELRNVTKVIGNFISYCNNQELEKAYDLLTDECKTQIYNTLEIFKQAYYDNVFGGEKKTCTIENWTGDTYKVKIISDLLATGKKTEDTKQDYITIKKVNGEEKLNINSYIGQKEINQITEKDNIKMEVLKKNTYMESEEYTIKVTNNKENDILLDTRTEAKTLYLQDANGMKYSFYSHELTKPMLTIPSRTNQRSNY